MDAGIRSVFPRQSADDVLHEQSRMAGASAVLEKVAVLERRRKIIVDPGHQPVTDAVQALVAKKRVQVRTADEIQVPDEIRGPVVLEVRLGRSVIASGMAFRAAFPEGGFAIDLVREPSRFMRGRITIAVLRGKLAKLRHGPSRSVFPYVRPQGLEIRKDVHAVRGDGGRAFLAPKADREQYQYQNRRDRESEPFNGHVSLYAGAPGFRVAPIFAPPRRSCARREAP